MFPLSFYFFLSVISTTEIYTLSLHDALPIFYRLRGPARPGGKCPELRAVLSQRVVRQVRAVPDGLVAIELQDRKSTRLNSSHANISYAVFCLKKKKKTKKKGRRVRHHIDGTI